MENKISPRISIIVPIYNVEKCLVKCIDSILAQSFNDFELILVDDGSPDNSCKICDEYALKDKRIKVIHKKNGGLSDARNVGILEAKGEYIGFIDSDDYIDPDMYKILYDNIEKYSAQVSICGLYDCYNNKIVPQCSEKELLVLNNEEALSAALIGKYFSVNAVNKLYKKELFNQIKFPVGKLSEDAYTIPKILAKAQKTVATTEPMYYYQHRVGTITTSEFKINDFNVVEAYSQNLEFINENFPKLKKQAQFRYLWSYMYVLDKMLLSKNFKDINKFKEVERFLKRNTLKILFNPYFSRKRKIITVIFLLNQKIYDKLLKYNKKRTAELFE